MLDIINNKDIMLNSKPNAPKNKDGKRACNKEMLKKLKNYMHTESEEEETPTDPRWDALKNLKNNN